MTKNASEKNSLDLANQEIDAFNILPDEVKLHIFSFFNKTNLINASWVSKEWHNLAIDPSLAKVLPRTLPEKIIQAVISQDGKKLALVTAKGNIYLITIKQTVLSQPTFIKKYSIHNINLLRISFTPSGHCLVVCEQIRTEGKTRITGVNLEAPEKYLYRLVLTNKSNTELIVIPLKNGNLLIAKEGEIKIWDPYTNRAVRSIFKPETEYHPSITHLFLSADESILVIARFINRLNIASVIHRYDMEKQIELPCYTTKLKRITQLAFIDANQMLTVTHEGMVSLHRLDHSEVQAKYILTLTEKTDSLSLHSSPNGLYAAIIMANGAATIIDTQTAQIIAPRFTAPQKIEAAFFNSGPVVNQLLTITADNVYLYDFHPPKLKQNANIQQDNSIEHHPSHCRIS